MKQGISYIRFSSRAQLKGHSYKRQLEACNKYCEQEGITLINSYEDLGVSAFTGKNSSEGQLAVILEMVKSGKIPNDTYLIIESLDRLTRTSIKPAITLFNNLTTNGINIVTLIDRMVYYHDKNESYDSKLDTGMMMYSLMVMAQANEESLKKSERISKKYDERRQNVIATKRPLGGKIPLWLEYDNDGEFVKNEFRCEIIKDIFNYSVADGLGSHAIATKLDSEGIAPWGARVNKKTGWSKTTISNILTDRKVLGEFQMFTTKTESNKKIQLGEPVSEYYPRIIEDSLFYQSRLMRAERRNKQGRKPSKKIDSNVFRGVAKCFCGSSLTYNNKNGSHDDNYIYLTCSNRKIIDKGKCKSQSIPYPRLKAFLLQICSNITPRGGESLSIIDYYKDILESKISQRKKDELKGKKLELNDKIAKILAVMDASGTDVIQLSEKIIEYKLQIDEISNQLSSSSNEDDKETIWSISTKMRSGTITHEEFTKLLNVAIKSLSSQSFKKGKNKHHILIEITLENNETHYYLACFNTTKTLENFYVHWVRDEQRSALLWYDEIALPFIEWLTSNQEAIRSREIKQRTGTVVFELYQKKQISSYGSIHSY